VGKVVLAQAQQRDIRFQDIAVDDTCPDGEGRIEQSFEISGLEILANKCQTGVRAEVVGELFIMKSVMIVFTFWVNSILHLSR